MKNSFFLTTFFIILILSLVYLLNLDSLGAALDNHWQFLDLPLLFKDPYGSLVSLHAQPPLLNFLAYLLHLIPGNLYTHFVVLNSILGGLVALIIYKVIYTYTGSNKYSFFSALVFLLYPSTLIYAAYPFYPMPTALGYTILAYSFSIAKSSHKQSLALLIFSTIYLSLLRSSFSQLHIIVFIVAYFVYVKGGEVVSAKKMFLVGLIAILPIAIISIKNYKLYHFYGVSSWQPINVANGVGIQFPDGAFPPPEIIVKKYPEIECISWHDQNLLLNKSNGYPNMNSCYVLGWAKKQKSELMDKYSLNGHISEVIKNSQIYFLASDSYSFNTNRVKIYVYADVVNKIMAILPANFGENTRTIYVLAIMMSLVIGVFNRKYLLSIFVLIVVIHFFTHVLVDGKESQRFVFDIEPILLMILTMLIYEFSQSLRGKLAKTNN